MKKRSLILSILCVVLAISMTSCAKDDDSSSQGFHGVDVADENGEYADSVYDTEIEKPPADTNSATTTLSPRDTHAGEVVTDPSDDTQVDNQGTVDSSADSSANTPDNTPDNNNSYYQHSDDDTIDEDRGYVFKKEDFEPVEEVKPECNKDIYDEDFDSFLRDRTGADRNYWIDKLVNNGFTRAEAEKEYEYWVALKQALASESESE